MSKTNGKLSIKTDGWRTTSKGCRSLTLRLSGLTVRITQRKPEGAFYRIVLIDGQQNWKSLDTYDESKAQQLGETFLREAAREVFRGVPDESDVTAGLGDAPQQPPIKHLTDREGEDVALTLPDLWDRYKEGGDYADNDEATKHDKRMRIPILIAGITRVVNDERRSRKLDDVGAVRVDHIDKDVLRKYLQLRARGGIAYLGSRSWNGKSLAPKARVTRAVRARTQEADMQLLRAMIFWAMDKTIDGKPLLTTNPMHGLKLPHEKNKERDVATYDRYERLVAKIDEIVEQLEDAMKKDRLLRLKMTLRITEATGRRIGAVRQLRREHLHLDETNAFTNPYITWTFDADKDERTAKLPIPRDLAQELALYCLEMKLPPSGFLFPVIDVKRRRGMLDQAMTTNQLSYLLKEIEVAAELPPLKRGRWHPFRRKFATERKGLPIRDVMNAMGIRTVNVFMECYQHGDDAAARTVIEHPHKLRDANVPRTTAATGTLLTV